MKSESTDDLDGELPVGEDDVVESDEQGSNVVCLSEMSIELFGEVLEDGLSNSSLCSNGRVEEKTRQMREDEGMKEEGVAAYQDRRFLRSGASRGLR